MQKCIKIHFCLHSFSFNNETTGFEREHTASFKNCSHIHFCMSGKQENVNSFQWNKIKRYSQTTGYFLNSKAKGKMLTFGAILHREKQMSMQC